MRSQFDKETSEGFYTFDSQEVFEALAMWVKNKGILLKDKQVSYFGCSGDPHFVVEMAFNDRKKEG